MLTAFAATSKSNDHDPYIWLEEVEGKEALARVEASNALELLHPYLRCCHQGLTIFFLCVRGLSKISCNFFFESIYKTTFADSHYLFLGCQSVSEPKEKPLITVEEVLNAQQ